MPVEPDHAFAAFLRENLPVGAVSGLPEIQLHQAGPRSGLRRWAERTGATAPPYWAHAWGGGLVLARFLLDRPEQVAGRHVLDLGCGSGLVAIAAAMAGAASVAARDIDPHAVAATALNAALNGVEVQASHGDLPDDLTGTPVGTVLVGDLFYAADLAARLTARLNRYVAAGTTVLVGDPGRVDLPVQHLACVFSRPMPDFGTGHTVSRPSAVYRFVGG